MLFKNIRRQLTLKHKPYNYLSIYLYLSISLPRIGTTITHSKISPDPTHHINMKGGGFFYIFFSSAYPCTTPELIYIFTINAVKNLNNKKLSIGFFFFLPYNKTLLFKLTTKKYSFTSKGVFFFLFFF